MSSSSICWCISCPTHYRTFGVMLVYQRGKILMAWTVVGGTLNPVASMGLVYFPTCTIKIKHPCRCIYIYPTWIQWEQDEKIVVETLDQEAESPPHRIAKAPVRRLGGLGFQPGGGNLWETKNAAKYIHPSHFFWGMESSNQIFVAQIRPTWKKHFEH